MDRHTLNAPQRPPTGGSAHSAQYPHAAALHLLAELRGRGLRVRNIDDAIRQGHLTDAQWCETLHAFREEAQSRGEAKEAPGLTPDLLDTLRALHGQSRSRADLARHLGVSEKAARIRLNHLIAAGYVAQQGSTRTRRCALTESGQQALSLEAP